MMVSVIIPSYNHGQFLQKRIDSVLCQTYPDFELIILDDHSTDNSREIIESYSGHPRVSTIRYNDQNSGKPFQQWAKGLEHAKGEWIWIAESDDVANPQFLSKMTALVHSDPGISFAYCDAVIKNDPVAAKNDQRFSVIKNRKYQTEKWSHPYIMEGNEELLILAKECTVNNVSSVLFNKEKLVGVITDAGRYRYHGDWLLYILLAKDGKIAYLPEALNIYRDHEKNHSKSGDYTYHSKKECFMIMDYLVKEYPGRKKELVNYFTSNYTGFGLLSERPFNSKGIFREYSSINKGLARQTLWSLLKKKFNPGKK